MVGLLSGSFDASAAVQLVVKVRVNDKVCIVFAVVCTGNLLIFFVPDFVTYASYD